MFQTEPILFLQSFAGSLPTFVMKGVTVTGYSWFLSLVILIVMLGLDFRRGFYLFQIIIWTAIITFATKQIVALPRPIWVDANVHNLETGQPNLTPFTGMGARGFFQLLPPIVVDANRQQGRSFGLPSGHVSSTVALWGGLTILFNLRFLSKIFPFLVLLMAISRMFLGQHFLADVLGGAVVGAIVLLVAGRFLTYTQHSGQVQLTPVRSLTLRWAGLLVAFVFIPLLLVSTSLEPGNLTGSLMGVSGAYLVVRKRGLPVSLGGIFRRAASFLLGAGIYFGATYLITRATGLAGLSINNAWVACAIAALAGFLGIGTSIALFLKIGLYGREAGRKEIGVS